MPEVELSYTYDLPWETVVRAYVSRYPKHEKIPMMLAQEMTRVEWKADEKHLEVARRMKADLDAPYWLKRLFGFYWAYMWQEVTIDIPARKMVCISSSNPDSKYYKAWETATWETDPEDPEHRCVFTVKSGLKLEPFFFNVQSIIENLLLKQFRGQFDNARKVDHAFIAMLQEADSKRTDKPSQETLLSESFSSWIRKSLTEQKASNIDEICPTVFGTDSWRHTIEIGPVEGKQL